MYKSATILVVFGATGDLFSRKLAPALFHLHENNQLPRDFSIIGVARRDLSEKDFKNHISQALSKHLDSSHSISDKFLSLFSYTQGVFENINDYRKLAKRLADFEKRRKVQANKLFYLAVPPHYYKTILGQLAASNLTQTNGSQAGWTRVLVEKPFGRNLAQAQKLDKLLAQLFKEEQIYRIDHYLAKEMLQNILTFRFANNLLEQVWNKHTVAKIEIKLLEHIGLKDRGSFYDGVGALLDVGQNHLLQMLALATMDDPGDLQPNSIRKKRADLLKQVKVLDKTTVRENTVRGQYEGFKLEAGVNKNSTTETYFKIKAFLDSTRWSGVPIILKSGKNLPRTQKEIIVTFRQPISCLCPEGSLDRFQNSVRFAIGPTPGISVQFWAKRPGSTMDVQEERLDFQYPYLSERNYIKEYSRLLLDCIAGDQTLFVSSQETMASWRFIDPIVSAWQQNVIPLRSYSKNSQIFDTSESVEINSLVRVKKELTKEIGVVGLGKMGGNIARHLLEKDWKVVGFNRTSQVTSNLEEEGLIGAYSLKELAEKIQHPRIIWLMLPAGPVIDKAIFGQNGLINFLRKKDIVIDAGNSFYKDSIRRAKELEQKGIVFVDVGISGGPEGARSGACLMVGGSKQAHQYLMPLFVDLAVAKGVQFFEGAGAGHFAKMVHNGIEYGMMQSIAEGFLLLKEASYKFDLENVARIYNRGSVIESRLMGWLEKAFKDHGNNLIGVSGTVARTGEAEATVKTARELNLTLKIIEESLNFRIKSEVEPSYAGRILSALRQQFGGHAISSPAVGKQQKGTGNKLKK